MCLFTESVMTKVLADFYNCGFGSDRRGWSGGACAGTGRQIVNFGKQKEVRQWTLVSVITRVA